MGIPYPFKLHQLVDAIQMSTHNIFFYKENQKKNEMQKHSIIIIEVPRLSFFF